MHRVLITAATVAAALLAGGAQASSVTATNGSQKSSSIVSWHCSDCEPPAAKPDLSNYKVPVLEPGTQKTEIIEINGEKRLVRTEAWFGGSPVVFVGKVPAWMDAGRTIANVPAPTSTSFEEMIENAPPPRDGIDLEATTSAVAPAPQVAEASAKPITFEDFSLRLKRAE
ncbi:plant virulence effector HPE1-like domain-containing protein [Rhizobium sp. NFR12]|uniref:plant virulence effector HPE1-like domain-containing protein n=1 Tax=Rhizobium sp. NFR12 TaxID=1566261 RepID=UPI0008A7B526|nr:plant virulence effector HPE1-like domain-containing protein [Rhizobium sp. NFR12]SEH23717.1 hypothetical protein SAMN03159407_1795 [Rhizobium sp. NFR12]